MTTIVKKDKTKSASSRRSFPLLPDIRKLFLDLKRIENDNRKAFGKSYVQSDFIFKWDDGRPYSPDFVSYKFDWLLKHYCFPHIRFHELLHTCAYLLLDSDFSTTANIYAHLDYSSKFCLPTHCFRDSIWAKSLDTSG